MINTLNDFIREYKKIVSMGWITTHRSGPTGIGKTLEDLLDITENNIDGPDFGDYELKSCRLNSNSMLTMFTKTPKPRGAANTLRETFGYSSDAYDNDEKVLHTTLSADRYVPIANTGHQLIVVCDLIKYQSLRKTKKSTLTGHANSLNKPSRKNTRINSSMQKLFLEEPVLQSNLNLQRPTKYPVLIMMPSYLYLSKVRFTLI